MKWRSDEPLALTHSLQRLRRAPLPPFTGAAVSLPPIAQRDANRIPIRATFIRKPRANRDCAGGSAEEARGQAIIPRSRAATFCARGTRRRGDGIEPPINPLIGQIENVKYMRAPRGIYLGREGLDERVRRQLGSALFIPSLLAAHRRFISGDRKNSRAELNIQ